MWATGFRVNSKKKSVASHYLAARFSPALALGLESEAFFCRISWRQTRSGYTRAKRGKRPRHIMWQPLLCPCAVFTATSEGFAPYYLAGIRHDLRQTTVHHGIEARRDQRGKKSPLEILIESIEDVLATFAGGNLLARVGPNPFNSDLSYRFQPEPDYRHDITLLQSQLGSLREIFASLEH